MSNDRPAVASENTSSRLEQLCVILGQRGACDAMTISRARAVVDETGQRLDKVLLQLGWVDEQSLAASYAELLDLPTVHAADYPLAAVPIDRLKPTYLRNARAIPLSVTDGVARIAVADPLDRITPRAIGVATGLRVQIEVALPIELDAALNRLYPVGGAVSVQENTGDATAQDAERLRDLASGAPIIRLVNKIIMQAVEINASDIHFETCVDRLRVRYRRDGVLFEAETHSVDCAAAVISRLKIMAQLDIAERRLPQDGRARIPVRGTEVDLRISTSPFLHGEKVVLRVLERSGMMLGCDQLGLSPQVVRHWWHSLTLPHGMILVTGPTGSGKTTTLYAALRTMDATSRNIVTVEDPVEYDIPGLNQAQVKPQIGLNFPGMLRSILRQDPDIILIGEIRDHETARIAVQAALTGHLVLSTLHTNSAAAAITRLRDLGLEDYLIASAIRGILAQRLVRRLCEHCRRSELATEALAEQMGLRCASGGRPVIWRSVGCAHCNNTGYRGRLAIAEFLNPDSKIIELILSRSHHTAIEAQARESGMETMLQAGLTAVSAGVTTVEEVIRAVETDR
ncbi:MAG TPA: ATPase, T2SS/T4P/T4SS family [Acetobacteraceae bacterium]|nr:ATPase, T2SS/T4P/T4SS family [Acetobacteraceae bacterium]